MATEQRQGNAGAGLGRAAAIVIGCFVVAAAVIAALALATRERSERNEAAQVMKVLRTVLPEGGYDNHPDQDRLLVESAEFLGSDEPLPVYRARLGETPVAAVITAVAPQGYVGPIRLLVAVRADGSVHAVRTIAHQETPGLGGRIDAARPGWLRRFAGRSLDDPPTARWEVRRDGGEFDQLTGATITSRAVVHAVRDALLWFEQHRDEVFARPAE
jgi:electron transport complex protein RnfG